MGLSRQIIDISRPLTEETAVWPGDQPFQPHWAARLDEGSTVNISTLVLSAHAGTHADAPLHVADDGLPIDKIPLLQFVGPCIVTHIKNTDVILPEDVAFNDVERVPRVLFKTRHSAVPDTEWRADFPYFAPATIERLAQQGVVLIGTDAPSVDRADSTTLDAHKALMRNGIVNVENLSLQAVEPGRYHLIALPLYVIGLDAAPVRAVLVVDEDTS